MSALAPTYARFPVEFASGSGCTLVDADGVEYLDFLAGIAVCSVGHCHPAVVAAVSEQAARLMHVSNLFTPRRWLRLAERLVARSLGGSVFFAQLGRGGQRGGASSSCARRGRGGDVVVVHGASTGAPTARCPRPRRRPSRRRSRRWCPGFRAVAGDAEAIAAAVDENTAAVLLEPSRASRACTRSGGEMLRAARAACDARGRRAGVRRGAVRDGADRDAVGLRADRRRARRDDPRQGARRRHADRRARDRPAARRTSSRPATTARPSPAGRSSPRRPTPRSTCSTTRPPAGGARARRAAGEGLRELPGVARSAAAG